MRKVIFSVLILLSPIAFSKSLTMDNLKAKALKEGWTFKFSERRHHGKGLKKKYILSDERKSFLDLKISIPNKMDLRPGLSPIQDQGDCGSCWAHSLTASLEDGYPSKSPSLSPQYLVDCAANAEGCDGGYFDAALYLIFPKGAPTRKSYPYTAKDGTCKNKPVAASIASYHLLGTSRGPSTRDIEAYMSKYKRPVSVTVAAGAGAWQNYDSGIYNGCELAGTDHMINIVGWDNEGFAFNTSGNLPHGKGVWILRNSWGVDWGEQGWMRTRMTDKSGHRCNNVAEEAAYFDFKKGNDLEDEPLVEEVTTQKPNVLVYLGLGVLALALLSQI